ncbi:NAD-dependent epimerase/dehydratase family protein [Streptomyces sp. BK022]|uniref:NAD-dependent epimerase/dehydratase family protein n=1 Tax=Streptomyces sp. BK022 TaxID=2512123 RepID=UPI001F5FD901|nr:NAD-dependent epimerase/dehydratase family protein [Streptomyces sp. BK022]
MLESKRKKFSTALITGGAGFIGGHLARALRQDGTTVRSVDDLRVAPLIKPDGNLLIKRVSDLTVDDVEGVDVVYHLASDKSVPLSFEAPLQYLENLESTEHLLRLCAVVDVPRVIIASTCEVYGRARTRPTPENEPLAPLSPYAASKVAMEMVARVHRHSAPLRNRVSVVRFFNVFGPGERPDAVIPRFCLGALTDGLLPVEGAGTQRRDFSFIDDVVDVLRRMPMAEPVPVINIGSGFTVSVLEIAEAIKGFCPRAEVKHVGGRQEEIPEFWADTAAQRTLVARPAVHADVREGIRKTLDWWASTSLVQNTVAGGWDGEDQPLLI